MKKICPKDSFKALCLTCSLCLSTACSVTAAEPNIETKLFQKIEAAGGINNLESVKDDIKRVLKLNPKHPGATFYAGQYCFQKGDFANAEKFLNRITTDPNYGSKANSILADIRLKKYNKRFMGTLRVYLTGESFAQALQLCEEALMDMPDNKELLFSASYAACMLGKKDRAESYAELYTTRTDNHELAAELKTLVDAWFTDDFDNQKDTGVKCPICGGKIVEKKSKRGRMFFGCSNYPKCTLTTWNKPTGELCPDCKAPLVWYNTKKQGDYVKCSAKGCKYKHIPEGNGAHKDGE